MAKKIKIQEAEALLEKYYEGLTNVIEERQLKDFLTQKKLPARFEPDKAMIGYFAAQKIQKKANVIYLRIWANVAAVFIAVLLTTGYLFNHSNANYVYINGEKYTDATIVKGVADASIKDLKESADEVTESTKLLENNEDMIEQQLSLLSDFN